MIDMTAAEHKLNQAKLHLEQSARVFREWETPDNVRLLLSRDPSLAMDTYDLAVRSLPPAGFTLAVGDFLSNARAALDYVAWRIYLTGGGTSDGKGAGGVYFPIASEGQGWASERKKIPTIWPEAEAVLRAVQDDRQEGPDNTLFMLHKLANSQKHRDMQLIALGKNSEASMRMTPQDGYVTAIMIARWPSPPLEPGCAYNLSQYVVFREGDPEMKPVPRESRFSADPPPAPVYSYALTDGQFSVELDHLVAMAERVEHIVRAARGLVAPS